MAQNSKQTNHLAPTTTNINTIN